MTFATSCATPPCFASSAAFMRLFFAMQPLCLMICRRDRAHVHTRAVTVLEIVKQVSGMLWPYLFNKQPDSLQRDDDVCTASYTDLVSCCYLLVQSTDHAALCLQNDGTFYLIDDVPKFAKYMSEPIKSQQGASPLDTPGYFVAGIVKGYLVSSGFPAECDTTFSFTMSMRSWYSADTCAVLRDGLHHCRRTLKAISYASDTVACSGINEVHLQVFLLPRMYAVLTPHGRSSRQSHSSGRSSSSSSARVRWRGRGGITGDLRC